MLNLSKPFFAKKGTRLSNVVKILVWLGSSYLTLAQHFQHPTPLLPNFALPTTLPILRRFSLVFQSIDENSTCWMLDYQHCNALLFKIKKEERNAKGRRRQSHQGLGKLPHLKNYNQFTLLQTPKVKTQAFPKSPWPTHVVIVLVAAPLLLL